MANAILRVLSDFGDAAGWLIAALVIWQYGRRILGDNNTAHENLQKDIKANAADIKANADSIKANGEAIAALREEIHAIAVNVAVLRDRSDRQPAPGGRGAGGGGA